MPAAGIAIALENTQGETLFKYSEQLTINFF